MKAQEFDINLENLYMLEMFFKEQFQGNYRYGTADYFYWKFILNKTKKGFVNCCLVNSKLVATASITPKTLLLKNKEIKIAEIGDTYVIRKYSGRGIFFKLVEQSKNIALAHNLNFIYGTPNFQSLPGYLKYCGFEKSKFIKPFSYSYQYEIKNYLKPKLGSFFSGLLNLTFRFFLKIHHFFMSLLNSFLYDYELHYISSFSNDFDKFFEMASKEWDFIFSKKSKYLNWRFCENPNNYSIILVKKSDNIVGYIVYRIVEGPITSKLVIADFLFLNKNLSAFSFVLSKIRKDVFKNNFSSINIWCDINSSYVSVLNKNGFIFKKEIPFINLMNSISSSSKSIKNIHFTISDTDNI